jgi:hypothetical protein
MRVWDTGLNTTFVKACSYTWADRDRSVSSARASVGPAPFQSRSRLRACSLDSKLAAGVVSDCNLCLHSVCGVDSNNHEYNCKRHHRSRCAGTKCVRRRQDEANDRTHGREPSSHEVTNPMSVEGRNDVSTYTAAASGCVCSHAEVRWREKGERRVKIALIQREAARQLLVSHTRMSALDSKSE